MPIFTYICDNGHIHDALATNGKNPIPCPECGHPAGRFFKVPQVITMQPYSTRAGDGVLTEIRSSKAESAYETQHGIAHLTDADMKNMRENLSGQKERIRKREFAKMDSFHVSYAKAEAEVGKMGKEFIKEQKAQEMAAAIE